MANKHRAETDIEIGGKTRVAKMSHSAMASIETELGIEVAEYVTDRLEKAQAAERGKKSTVKYLPSARVNEAVLYHALAAVDPSLDRSDVATWMDERPGMHWGMMALSLLAMGFTGSAEGNE